MAAVAMKAAQAWRNINSAHGSAKRSGSEAENILS
jgi:hypothetical protein